MDVVAAVSIAPNVGAAGAGVCANFIHELMRTRAVSMTMRALVTVTVQVKKNMMMKRYDGICDEHMEGEAQETATTSPTPTASPVSMLRAPPCTPCESSPSTWLLGTTVWVFVNTRAHFHTT